MWTQFDLVHDGFLTGPSYGQGYALQSMLLMDRPELYTPAANWLARATFAPENPDHTREPALVLRALLLAGRSGAERPVTKAVGR